MRNDFAEGGSFHRKTSISQLGPFGYEMVSQGKPLFAGGSFGCEISVGEQIPLFLCIFGSLWLPSTSFEIPSDFDHSKTYVKSKQSKIKALKSKLKQVIK